MAIKRDDNPIIGTRGVICGFMRGGKNIIRASSSLTGERVKIDPAFEGFRKSGNRMKQASVIAASLYNQIPQKQKQFSLYRQLTGQVLKMLKEGVGKEIIVEQLQHQFIDPILWQPVRYQAPERKTKQSHRSAFSVKSLFEILTIPAQEKGLQRSLEANESFENKFRLSGTSVRPSPLPSAMSKRFQKWP